MSAPAHDDSPWPEILTDAPYRIDIEFYGADTSAPLAFDEGSTFSLVLAPAGRSRPDQDMVFEMGAGVSLSSPHIVSIAFSLAQAGALTPGDQDVELRQLLDGEPVGAIYTAMVPVARGLSERAELGGGRPLSGGGAPTVQVFNRVRVVRGAAAGSAGAAAASAAEAAEAAGAALDHLTQTGLDAEATAADRIAAHDDAAAAAVSAGEAAESASDTRDLFTATLIVATLMPPESGYVFALIDPSTRQSCLRVTTAGEVEIDVLTVPDQWLGYDKLSAEVQGLIPATLLPESGYAFALIDPVTGRSPFRVTTAGRVEFSDIALPDAIVTRPKLAADVVKLIDPIAADGAFVMPDKWRGATVEWGVRTGAEGSDWVAFAATPTKALSGVNNSGTGLDFRRSSHLRLRGRRYCGTFDASAGPSTHDLALNFVTGVSYPPFTGGPYAEGDYAQFFDKTSATFGADTFIIGDLAVYKSAAWGKQTGPVPFGASADYSVRQPGDWWHVTVAGTFDGVAYAVDDVIVYLGLESSGTRGYARWRKADIVNGDLHYRAEFDPAGGLPASPKNSFVYQASAAGAAGGYTFAVGDYLVRTEGVWCQVPTEAIKSVASAAAVHLPCVASADEWEVRRTDKGAIRVGVNLKTRRQFQPKRTSSNLSLWSDSMFGVNGIGAAIIAAHTAAFGVTGDLHAFGSSESHDILAMMERRIAVLGDDERDRIHLFYQGQNNRPVDEVKMAEVLQTAAALERLIGVQGARAIHFSLTGRADMSFNGTRLVCSSQEDAFNGVSGSWVLRMEAALAGMFPGRVVNTRQVLLAASVGRTAPDPRFPNPGFANHSEAYVAANYGVIPWSFFNEATGFPIPVEELNFVGYWTSTSLPTGGSDKDYYLRSGGSNGTTRLIGQPIYKLAGTWVEWPTDTTHHGAAAAAPIAAAEIALVTTLGW
jgi:hypothetical protein